MKINSKVIGSIVITVIALLVIGSYFKVLPFSVTGFSTLSLSPNSDFQSNDPLLGGKAWILTVSQNGAGQSAYGSFTAKDTTGEASNPFTISTNLDKDQALYSISNTGQPITHLQYTTTTYNPFSSSGGCNMDVWEHYYKSSASLTVYCYKTTNSAYLGSISAPNLNFQSTITIAGSGGSDSCVLSNVVTTSCVSNGGKFSASWVGSLISGDSPPNAQASNIVGLYKTSSNGWITADQFAYNSWKDKNSNLLSCISSLPNSQGGTCFDNINNLESNLLAGKPFTTSGGTQAVTSGTQANGQVTIDLPKQLAFPVISMRVKADLIGINIPVGKPKIISASAPSFKTGSNGIITVVVSNVGTGIGSFDLSASCSSGFSQVGTTTRLSGIAPNAQQTVYLSLNSNVVSSDLKGNCILTATDVNNPTNKDTYSVDVISSAISICNSGDTRANGNNIEQCTNNIWTIIQSCNQTQTPNYVGTTLKCINSPSISSSNFLSSIGSWFKNLFSGIYNTFEIIKWIVIIAGSILVGLVMDNLLMFNNSLRKNNKSRVIFSIIFAILVGVFLYSFIYSFFFWLLLIVAAVLFIAIKFFKPF